MGESQLERKGKAEMGHQGLLGGPSLRPHNNFEAVQQLPSGRRSCPASPHSVDQSTQQSVPDQEYCLYATRRS